MEQRDMPKVDQVILFWTEIRLPGGAVEAARFFAHYEANGWIGWNSRPVKDWQAAARQWSRRKVDRPQPQGGAMVKQTAPGAVKAAVQIENAAAQYLLTLHSEASRYMQGKKLDKAARELSGGDIASWRDYPWHRLTAPVIQALVTALLSRHKPAYVNAILAALRGVAKALYREEIISEREYRNIRSIKAAKVYRSEDALPGRYVTEGERAALFRACLADDTPGGIRDAAIIACAYPGGLRRTEIADLALEDVTLEDGGTVALRVTGKGRRERTVFLDNGGALAVTEWLRLRGDASGPLFCHCTRRDVIIAGVTGQAVYNVMRKRAREAGIPEIGAHDLRRTTASDLLDITDTVTAAASLGHSSTNTTAIYDRRGQRAKRKAAACLTIPYSLKRIL